MKKIILLFLKFSLLENSLMMQTCKQCLQNANGFMALYVLYSLVCVGLHVCILF